MELLQRHLTGYRTANATNPSPPQSQVSSSDSAVSREGLFVMLMAALLLLLWCALCCDEDCGGTLNWRQRCKECFPAWGSERYLPVMNRDEIVVDIAIGASSEGHARSSSRAKKTYGSATVDAKEAGMSSVDVTVAPRSLRGS